MYEELIYALNLVGEFEDAEDYLWYLHDQEAENAGEDHQLGLGRRRERDDGTVDITSKTTDGTLRTYWNGAKVIHEWR